MLRLFLITGLILISSCSSIVPPVDKPLLEMDSSYRIDYFLEPAPKCTRLGYRLFFKQLELSNNNTRKKQQSKVINSKNTQIISLYKTTLDLIDQEPQPFIKVCAIYAFLSGQLDASFLANHIDFTPVLTQGLKKLEEIHYHGFKKDKSTLIAKYNQNLKQYYPVVQFVEKVNSDSVFSTIKKIETLKTKNINGIILVINSPGGNVWSGVALYNYLKSSHIPVHTHNISQAASAASLVYCAGDFRTADLHASFLLHDLRLTSPSHIKNLQSHLLSNKLITEIIFNCIDQPEPLDSIATKMANEWYLSAEESLLIRLAEQISNNLSSGYTYDALKKLYKN